MAGADDVLISKPGEKEDLCIKGDTGEVNETIGLICLILNIVWPGLGTIIAGVASTKGFSCAAVIIGICQMVLCAIIIGWIWSICHGYHIYVRSKGRT